MAKQRRRAIEAKLIEESKTSPGYFKYQVTIREIDGKVHTIPAYGYDMQDAIKRLIRIERNDKITEVYNKKIEPITVFGLGIGWVGCVLASALLNNYQYAYWAVISIFSILSLYIITRFIRGL
jgi:hypothetical protein